MIYLIKILGAVLLSIIICYLFWKFSEKHKQVNFKEYLSTKFFFIFSAMLAGMLCSALT